MKNKIIFSIVALLFIVSLVSAAGNETNSTLINDTINQTSPDANITNSSSINQTLIEDPLFLKNVYPSNFNLGEAQFNIQIENKGDSTLENVIPLITAQGLLTSSIIPIEVLSAKSTGYILVMGRFTKNGTIPLEIRIGSQKMSYNITINSELSPQISNESELGYDISSISLSDAKKYLRGAESSILTSDISSAKANLKLASEELSDQNIKLANAKPISWFTKLKTNSLAFSAVAGALVTIFAAYELLKKKGSAVHSVVVSKVYEAKGKIVK